LDRLDVEVRKAFPHKFSNPNRERTGNVESSTTRGTKSKDTFELNEQEQRICNTFVRDGVMTKEEYIQKAKNKAISTFAVLRDNQWFEKGEMGWWGCVSNEKDQDKWNEEFGKLLSELPDDTLLTIVDCHI